MSEPGIVEVVLTNVEEIRRRVEWLVSLNATLSAENTELRSQLEAMKKVVREWKKARDFWKHDGMPESLQALDSAEEALVAAIQEVKP